MKKIFKWIGIVLGSLVGLILIAALTLFLMGNARLNKTYDFPATNLEIPTDEESLAYGKHRVETLCAGCHGADLSGLENWFDGGPLGTIDSANLTTGEGGIGDDFSAEDFVRAVRHGINQEGKPNFMIAVGSTSYLSDEDLASIIAYIQTVPPVDHVVAGKQFTPLAKILLAAGILPNVPVEEVTHEVHVSAPERGASAAYGEYMVNINDCRLCHGPELNGGPFPDPTIMRISPNLTPGSELAFWTDADFINTIPVYRVAKSNLPQEQTMSTEKEGSIKVIVELHTKPSKRTELKHLLESVATTLGPTEPGFLAARADQRRLRTFGRTVGRAIQGHGHQTTTLTAGQHYVQVICHGSQITLL